jgi:hypothetical protein
MPPVRGLIRGRHEHSTSSPSNLAGPAIDRAPLRPLHPHAKRSDLHARLAHLRRRLARVGRDRRRPHRGCGCRSACWLAADCPGQREFAGLRLYWQSAGLSSEIKIAINEAVALASARSICTCEVCAEPGRLFERGGWLLTRCEDHAHGNPVAIRPGRENLHIVRTIDAGRIRIKPPLRPRNGFVR